MDYIIPVSGRSERPKSGTHRESLRSKFLPRAKRSSSVDRPWPGYADMVTIRRNRVGVISHARSFLCEREVPPSTSRDGYCQHTGTSERQPSWSGPKLNLMKAFRPGPTSLDPPAHAVQGTQGEKLKPDFKIVVWHNDLTLFPRDTVKVKNPARPSVHPKVWFSDLRN